MKPIHLAVLVPAVALVAACGTTSHQDSGAKAAPADGKPLTASAPDAAPLSLGRDYASTGDAAGSTETGTGGSAETASSQDPGIQGRSVISQGQISLHARDIDQARFDLVKVLDTYGATISAENSSGDDHGRTERDRLEIRVPAKNFAAAMDDIAALRLGTLVERTSTSTDVTTKVIDVNTRVRTQRLSLARVQALLDHATTIDEIIRIESQVARRQADLDSLEQQQKYLADQTALSTITVYLTVPDKPATAKKKDKHTFFSGLSAGWDSLGSSTSAVLTAIGAVLPFAALLALLGVPAWVAWRRRTRAAAA
jgi:hypothetical protein